MELASLKPETQALMHAGSEIGVLTGVNSRGIRHFENERVSAFFH